MRACVLKTGNLPGRGQFHAGEVIEMSYADFLVNRALGNVRPVDDPVKELVRNLSDAAMEPVRRAYEEKRAERRAEFEVDKGFWMRRHYDRRRV